MELADPMTLYFFFELFFTDIIVGEKDKNQNIPYMADLIWQEGRLKKINWRHMKNSVPPSSWYHR